MDHCFPITSYCYPIEARYLSLSFLSCAGLILLEWNTYWIIKMSDEAKIAIMIIRVFFMTACRPSSIPLVTLSRRHTSELCRCRHLNKRIDAQCTSHMHISNTSLERGWIVFRECISPHFAFFLDPPIRHFVYIEKSNYSQVIITLLHRPLSLPFNL